MSILRETVHMSLEDLKTQFSEIQLCWNREIVENTFKSWWPLWHYSTFLLLLVQCMNMFSFDHFCRTCVLGTANGWFLKIQSKIHVDQIVEAFAQNSPKLERLEIQWDPDTIRFSDKSNKFVDHIRLVLVIWSLLILNSWWLLVVVGSM